MKFHQAIPALFLALTVLPVGLLGAEKAVAGPNGGRLFQTEGQKTEFVVTEDRKVEVRFYDAAMKPVAPAAQVVGIIAELPSGPTKVDLEKTAEGFVSASSLPEAAEPYRVVIQVRARPEARPQNFRVDLNLARCEECRLKEYACTCEAH